MHRTQRIVLQRLKCVAQAIRVASTLIPRIKKQNSNLILQYPAGSKPIAAATQSDSDETKASSSRPGEEQLQELCKTEVYLPCHVWDALNPTERFASVADLCAHLGDQLPAQVVKLIARDILRELSHLHTTRGIPHNKINSSNILLSPTDLRALVSQLRGESQTSLDSSELTTMGLASFNYDDMSSPKAIAVFTLTDPEAECRSYQATATFLALITGLCADRFECISETPLHAPEIVLGATCGPSADMWTLGCVLFELLTGKPLFEPTFLTVELEISQEESHIIQMIELFGPIPPDLIEAGKFCDQWFAEDGALHSGTNYYPVGLGSILKKSLEKKDVAGAASLLDPMLKIRSADRAQPSDLIDHYWFSES